MKMTKKQARALRKANLDLFDSAASAEGFDSLDGSPTDLARCVQTDLPAESDLTLMFRRINQSIFGGRLPQVKVMYSDRMLIAGSYRPDKKEIRIGRKYHTIFPADLEDTLMHEMIHIIYPDHSRKFKSLARRLGVSLKAREHPELRSACRYIYYCPICGKEYPRRKHFRMASCGECTPGKEYDSRFKLKLLKSRRKS
jgi:predicted SprT family Zn-dependent metalloprotease